MRPRSVASRSVAAVLGLLLALVVAEMALRVYSAVQVSSASSRGRTGDHDGRPIVAFAGDSNVYGLYVAPEETLSEEVQRLSRREGAVGIHAVNRALPGAPSWVVLEQVREVLALRPAAVVVRCGINNLTSIPPGEGLGPLEHLRLVKLLRNRLTNAAIAKGRPTPLVPDQLEGEIGRGVAVTEDGRTFVTVARRDGVRADFEVQSVSGSVPEGKAMDRLVSDLLEIAREVERAGAKLVILTYLAGLDPHFAPTRKVALSMQGRHDAVVVDCAALLPGAIRGDDPAPMATWSHARAASRGSLYLTRDRHPTALGYALEARAVANALRELGIPATSRTEDPLEVARAAHEPLPVLRRVADSAREVDLVARTGDRATLLVGTVGNSSWNGLEVPVDLVGSPEGFEIRSQEVSDPSGAARFDLQGARSTGDAPLVAACVIERDGRAGAARILFTDPIPLFTGARESAPGPVR